ncbi:uncharacterized protein [Rutidosis leptorrhynchoides]|uniref:uncharacterized protein n=1 Tax=Rutidosis leptorrhynchoides TaxID=125765 RepID=UPI003A98E67E
MARLFGCTVGTFPCTYLGLPIGANMNKKVNWKPVLNKFEKRLAEWKARLYLEELGIEFSNSFKRQIGNGKDTSFWYDTWISSTPLYLQFKRLFRLDNEPQASVQSRKGWDGNTCIGVWDWVRQPRGRTGAKFKELLFKVLWSTLSKRIDGVGRFVLMKVGVFIWRALNGRLPVVSEIDKRGIDLHSVRCPICDNDIEMIQHALLQRHKSIEIWDKVFKWFEVPSGTLGYNNVFRGISSFQTSGIGAKVWQAIEWTCGYLIWKNRNNMVFKKSCWNPPVALNEI